MSIIEIKEMYDRGDINKIQYEKESFKFQEELFQLQSLMRDSWISDIIINNDDVIYRSLISQDDGEAYSVDMKLYEKDETAVPVRILNYGEYEVEELNMVMKIVGLLGECSVFDIGANLGWYSINICKRFPKVISYAFEPIKDTYDKLIDNIKLNNLNNCICDSIGFYKDNKTQEFYSDVIGSAASSMADLRHLPSTIKLECEVRRLDDYVTQKNIAGIDFIKCDVEGSELFVYEGGIESIKRFKPVIFSELLRKWSALFGYHPNDVIDLFSNIGYQCYVINDNHLAKFGIVNEDTIDTNYFFLHKIKHESLIKALCK